MTEGLLAVDLSARARSVAVQTEGSGDTSAMRSDVAMCHVRKVFFEALQAVIQGDYSETSEERRNQWMRNWCKISVDMFNLFLFQVATSCQE